MPPATSRGLKQSQRKEKKIDITSPTRDVSQEVWEAMGGEAKPITPTPKPPPSPIPKQAQTRDVTQINRGQPPPPGWKVSDKYLSTPETGPVYEDRQGNTYVMVGTNPAGQVYMELEKAKAGTKYYDPVYLRRLSIEQPYLYTKLMTEGEKGFKEAISKREKDIEVIKQKAEIPRRKWIRENITSDPYLKGIMATKGEDVAIKAWEDRQRALSGISERSQKRYQEELKIFETELKASSPELYDVYKRDGVKAYEVAARTQNLKYKIAMAAVKGHIDKDGNIDIAGYLMKSNNKDPLYELGVKEADIKTAERYNAYQMGSGKYTEKYFKDRGWGSIEIPWAAPGSKATQKDIDKFEKRVREAQKEYYKLVPEKKPTTLLKEFSLSMIPVYGTYRYYEQAKQDGLSTGEKAMLAGSAATDLLIIIPVIGQISAGARFARGISTGARLAGADKATGQVAIAEIKAPFTILAHPKQTAKVALSPIETALRRTKVPLSAIETKYNTVRLPFAITGKETLTLRDAVTSAMIENKATKAAIGGSSVNLTPAAINKLGKPVAIHTTKDIRPFIDGAKLTDDLYVAPTHHSRFTYMDSRGFGAGPDAIHGGLLINDARLIKLMQSSGKPYKGTAEIERIIPKGIELGKPVQTLVSRNSAGDKLTFLVFGEKYTNKELAKMKFIGSVDTVRQIYTPAIKAKGKAFKVYDEFADIVQKKKVLLNQIKKYEKAKDIKRLNKSRLELKALESRINRLFPRLERSSFYEFSCTINDG